MQLQLHITDTTQSQGRLEHWDTKTDYAGDRISDAPSQELTRSQKRLNTAGTSDGDGIADKYFV